MLNDTITSRLCLIYIKKYLINWENKKLLLIMMTKDYFTTILYGIRTLSLEIVMSISYY